MGESKVKFGDKVFLYGQFMSLAQEFDDYEYNAVLGYMTVGGYNVKPKETDDFAASMSGFVVDFGTATSLEEMTFRTPERLRMIDITEKLALSLPLPVGTKVWLPMPIEQ